MINITINIQDDKLGINCSVESKISNSYSKQINLDKSSILTEIIDLLKEKIISNYLCEEEKLKEKDIKLNPNE